MTKLSEDALYGIANDAVLKRLHDAVNNAVGQRIVAERQMRGQDMLIAVLEAMCPAEVSIAREVLAKARREPIVTYHDAGVVTPLHPNRE